jgi:YfiH family protein
MDIKWIDDSEQGMKFHRKESCLYLTFPELDRFDWLYQSYSTRFGGVSEGYFSSMSFRFDSEDPAENLHENFRRYGEATGFNPEHLVCSAQTHTTNVVRVSKNDRGRGYSRERGWQDVDGMITNDPDVVLATFYADCVPLYFVDPVHHAIGLSHSGWRGTAAKMGQVTVRKMQEEFDSDPSQMYAAIGPSICQQCYEVGPEVAKNFHNCYLIPEQNGRFLLDLQEVNRGIMVSAGIPVEHISMPNLCTCCNPDLFHSHRATKGKRGNNGAFLAIRS